jgi:hypothetical protein
MPQLAAFYLGPIPVYPVIYNSFKDRQQLMSIKCGLALLIPDRLPRLKIGQFQPEPDYSGLRNRNTRLG